MTHGSVKTPQWNMRKQRSRQSNGSKSQSTDLKNTGAATSGRVLHEASERSNSSDGAIELIRAQAYLLFELRGQQPGHALDDWLQAEREILQSVSSGNHGFTCSC